MFAEISNDDRQLVLKFMSGRSRLQPGVKQHISIRGKNEDRLPVGHTCGNTMDVPMYSSIEKMKEKVLIAVRLCGEIDDDAEYMNDSSNGGGSQYLGE